jgi:quercetin dioxygenase-like cupin family protein
MKAMAYKEIEPRHFDGETVRGVAGRVAIGKADGAGNFCMRVFEVSPGGFTPRHAHDWEHEMFIHSGQGQIFCQGRWNQVKPGDVVFVESNAEHQIKNPGQDLLVFACLVPAKAPEL